MTADVAMPQDVTAELAVLSQMLAEPGCRAALAAVVTPSDYWVPTHGDYARLMYDLDDYDPPAVLSEARRRRLDITLLPRLVGLASTTGLALTHARQVADCARRRALIEAGTRAVQQASKPACDVRDALVALMARTETLIEDREPVTPPMTVADFLRGEDHYDWVIDGLIERDDRVMITGGEGSGKSMLLAQIAVAAAGGVHPFTGSRIPPARVVIVDVENSRPILRRRLRPMLAAADDLYHRPVDPDRLRMIHRPEGLDLGRLDDQGWLVDRVCAARPDLVVIGPLYRLHTASLDKEDAARQITVALDDIRHRARCALLIEAHAPHGIGGQRWWRPAGSSLWMRWAPFGLGLKACDGGEAELVSWRGPRDQRSWPERLRRSATGWPWAECMPTSGTWTERRDLA